MTRTKSLATAGWLAALGLILSGCASTSERIAVQQIASAETSIELAEDSGAREYGASALDRAQDHLAEARAAADEGDEERAARLASEAKAGAELATARASRGKAEEALAELNQSVQTLQREIARSNTE